MLKFSFKIILFGLMTLTTFSQNLEPEPFYFDNWDKNDSTNLAPLDKATFKQTKIIRGFQWYGDYGFINALNMNTKINGTINYSYEDSCDPDIDSLSYDEPINDVRQPGVCHNMVGMQYEPTLLTDDFRNFNKRSNDPTNAIFGFNNIHGTILDSSMSGNVNYNRLILYQDSMSTYPSDRVVLSDITPNNQFFTFI